MRAASLIAGLLAVAGTAQAACVDIAADGDWRALPGTGPIIEVYAAGTWRADPALRPVGPGGHLGEDTAAAAPRIAQGYPLGALLIANEAKRVWSYRDFGRVVMGGLLSGRLVTTGRLFARINDAPDAMADNSGAVTLCLERVSE
ncbi:MAG: hypothetical protein ACFBRM_12905 [Pikeienuella sp.]